MMQGYKGLIKGYETNVIAYPFITYITLTITVCIIMFDIENSRIITYKNNFAALSNFVRRYHHFSLLTFHF